MAPSFFLAIGSRPMRRDYEVAIAAGQRQFLIPTGSTAIVWLKSQPGISVVLDSAAWPPDNNERPTLEDYAREILSWRRPDGTWGNLAWAASYDHIGNPERTRRDHARLLAMLRLMDAPDAPIVASIQYPEDGAAAILGDVDLNTNVHGGHPRARYGVGGLVPVLSPTTVRAAHQEAEAWFDEMLANLEWSADDGIDPSLLQLHIFGISRPAFLLRSPLIASFDSSGPIQMASNGWQKIAPRYNPIYGLSAEKLQQSRSARLAYWILDYRSRAGLEYQPVTDDLFENDSAPPAALQLSLDTWLLAA